MYEDASRRPLEVPTPHHLLLEEFLAARAAVMPTYVLARDREVIEWFRAHMVGRDDSDGCSVPLDELAGGAVAVTGLSRPTCSAAQRIMLEIRTAIAAGIPPTKAAPMQDSSARLVLRILGRWMLHVRLVNEIGEPADRLHRGALRPGTTDAAPSPATGRQRRTVDGGDSRASAHISRRICSAELSRVTPAVSVAALVVLWPRRSPAQDGHGLRRLRLMMRGDDDPIPVC